MFIFRVHKLTQLIFIGSPVKPITYYFLRFTINPLVLSLGSPVKTLTMFVLRANKQTQEVNEQ